MVRYNNAIFKSTHNSYSGDEQGKKGSILHQLNNKIYGIELDIFGLDNFRIGHLNIGHEVHLNDGNPSELNENKYQLNTWLKIIKDWSDKEKNHVPITVFIDIRLIIEKASKFHIDKLNSIIGDVFQEKLYKPEDLGNSDWPTIDELRGKIIVVLTGEKKVKCRYIEEFSKAKRNCFISFSYVLDGAGRAGKGKKLLDNANFINVEIRYWKWAIDQFNNKKVIRLYFFHKIFDLKTYKKCERIKCNFPATDYPYTDSYIEFLRTLRDSHEDLDLIEE